MNIKSGLKTALVLAVGIVLSVIKTNNDSEKTHYEDGDQHSVETPDISKEQYFGGLPISQIDQIAKNIYRGVGAELSGGGIDFIFKSASGKTTHRRLFRINDNGDLEMVLFAGNYESANAPKEFYRQLQKAMNDAKK